MKPQEFLKENEFIGDDAHNMHQSHQHHMLREECYHSAANAIKLHKLLGELPEGHDLDAWAAEKISLANDYLKTVTEWLEYDVMGGTNEAMMAGGMEAFSMESAERQYAELLGEDQGVAEARNTNPRVNEIRQLAKDFFGGNPYSSGTIGGGTVLRLSFHIGGNLDGDYRYVPAAQISPKDQQTLKSIKSKFEKFMASKGVIASEVSLKFHIGSGVYAGVRIAIPQEQDVAEDRTETKNDRGEVTQWQDEGPWKKSTGKDPRGQVTRASDRARRETEKLNKQPTVAENTLDQDLDKIAENFSSSISTVFNPGSGPKTGSLFGGSYKSPDSPFAEKKRSSKKSSVIKR